MALWSINITSDNKSQILKKKSKAYHDVIDKTR